MPIKSSIISNYWDLIDYNVHHIQHSELKASLILTAYGLVFGLAYDVSGNLPVPENYKYILYALIAILIGFTLLSIFFAFKTYIPRINQKLKKSVFFFHDINFHYKEADKYSKELIKVMEDDKKLKELLAEQAFINGVIASQKYMNVSKAIKFMIYSFGTLILILLFEFLMM
jgi:hypothetical protein|tara:strand:+ start:850 stop:1365 length:516 start_codon:yes stop_codon:yes gene_type:complete